MRAGRGIHPVRYAEVDDLRRIVFQYENVARLDVPVNQAALVRRLQAPANLANHVDRPLDRQSLAGRADQPVQRNARQQRHHQVGFDAVAVLELSDIINLYNIRMD